jgi:hypothetical protein
VATGSLSGWNLLCPLSLPMQRFRHDTWDSPPTLTLMS